jgi:hypothetical protein
MTKDLILQLVQVALALAQTQLEPGEAATALAGIVQRGVAAYQAHTGETLDLSLIKPESPL